MQVDDIRIKLYRSLLRFSIVNKAFTVSRSCQSRRLESLPTTFQCCLSLAQGRSNSRACVFCLCWPKMASRNQCGVIMNVTAQSGLGQNK